MARRCEGGRVMSLREFIDTNMTETQFQELVVGFAETHGWLTYHTFDSRRSQAGFPDLTMVRHGRLVFAELKSAAGKVTEDQQRWIEALGVRHEVYVWRPADWAEVKRVLE